MRTLIRDVVWMGLFAAGMTGCVAIPIATVFAIGNVLHGPDSEVLVPIFLAMGSFAFFLSMGLLYVLQHRRRLRERGAPTPVECDEEAQLMQELHQRSLQMERRMESLETILLGRVEHREHSEY